MTELYLIRLDRTNKAAFQALFPVTVPVENPTPEQEADCTILNDPQHEAAVQHFLSANRSALLPHLFIRKQNTYLFSHTDAPPTSLPNIVARPATGTNQAYDDFIAGLKKLISIEITDGGQSIDVQMDPLPIGEEIAILFKNPTTNRWAVASASTRPKISYMHDLVAHTKIPGLPTQLGITRFRDGTQILNRFYLSNYLLSDGSYRDEQHEVCVASLYTRKPNGTVEKNLDNEDFLLTQFTKPAVWLNEQTKKYGDVVEFKQVTNANQCTPFMIGGGHFSINKTKHSRDGSPTLRDAKGRIIPIIGGDFLQVDYLGNPIIQQDNASVLERIMYLLTGLDSEIPKILPSPTPPSAEITTSHPMGTATIHSWWAKDITNVASISEPVTGTIKVEFTDNSYLLDTGNKLALYGNPAEDRLHAMVHHARDNWGGQLHIEGNDTSIRKQIWMIAKVNGLTVTGYQPSSQDNEILAQIIRKMAAENGPHRPSPPQPNPQAGVQHAPAPAA